MRGGTSKVFLCLVLLLTFAFSVSAESIETDGGNNPTIKGKVDFETATSILPIEDYCSLDGLFGDCSGSECEVGEYYLYAGRMKLEHYGCLECVDGACLELRDECESLGDSVYECSLGEILENAFCDEGSDLNITGFHEDKVFIEVNNNKRDIGQHFSPKVNDKFEIYCGSSGNEIGNVVRVLSIGSGLVKFEIKDFNEAVYWKEQKEQNEKARAELGNMLEQMDDCEGCFTGKDCLSFGDYFEGKVCDGERMVNKKGMGELCKFDSECVTDKCDKGICEEKGFFGKISNWFSSLF